MYKIPRLTVGERSSGFAALSVVIIIGWVISFSSIGGRN